ncbi:Vacuolar protein sorting-associated protein 45 [Tritrichomonas foetus]|uniref:Vacuolar protein sorting-associated protein 45 n=1 Tax=Tritrichomonas foetus TaxID=1144522 RepID=A0A1J4JNJ1_9EUKA|nr:Vacuolar protein sorting-associated protein 45 [Tritrichomonas foetus]|eukprot:OHS99075.1 Vacuolar protein sorting-associated protein 45 [Tritrichomonas foetus]
MNILTSSYRYLEDILNENCGVKALITDAETLTTISLSMTRTELFSHSVIDTEELSEVCGRPVNTIVSALKCVCILRPSRENIELLSTEISSSPHFSRYSLYFTNTLFEPQIRQLARFDKFGLIDHVEEVFLDYYPLNHRLFSLNYPSIADLRVNQSADLLLTRITDGVFASLCSLQLRPVVRYDSNSPLCKLFAKSISDRISGSNYEAPGEQSLLLILDRMSDPLAALLHPWFYSGAIHDLFGLRNNLVTIPSKNEPIVFDERHDTFIQEYGCRFLADVGPAVAQKMADAKRLNESAKKQIQTPDQIADVVNAATKFQEQFSVIGNHVALVEAITAQVNSSSLIKIGEIEQAMATSDDFQGHFNEIMKLGQEITSRDEMLRLLMIYALRYENRANEQLNSLKEAFPSCEPLMDAIIKIAGNEKRGPDDVFGSRRKLTQLFTDIRALCVEQSQVLDQYKCLLASIIDRIKKGQLSVENYPYMGTKKSDSFRPRRVVVFYMGGTTYYEMRTAAQANDIDVIVGGTAVHNAASFIRSEVQPFT